MSTGVRLTDCYVELLKGSWRVMEVWLCVESPESLKRGWEKQLVSVQP